MIRTTIAAALLAASSLAATPPARAQSAVTLPVLARGEMLLEVNAVGIARSPATGAAISVSVTGNGASEEEAKRDLEATVALVTAAAREAGVAESNIEVTPGESGETIDDLADFDDVQTAEPVEPEPQPNRRRRNRGVPVPEQAPPAISYFANSEIAIRLNEAARAAGLHARFSEMEDVTATNPTYDLADERPGRRAARAQAMQNARADAEAYAEALGMRIARVLRVTERVGFNAIGMLLSESNTIVRTVEDLPSTITDAEVETYVIAGVDFALAPR